MSSRTEIVGMKELERTIKELGKLPQKIVNKSARAGASFILKQAKANAPELTGMLKRGIKLVPERSQKRGKKVFQVVMDRNMNDIFSKEHDAGTFHSTVRNVRNRKRKKRKVGDKVRSYYPASMEYGYFARNGRYIPGFHFLRNAVDKNDKLIETLIFSSLNNSLDRLLLAKGGMK